MARVEPRNEQLPRLDNKNKHNNLLKRSAVTLRPNRILEIPRQSRFIQFQQYPQFLQKKQQSPLKMRDLANMLAGTDFVVEVVELDYLCFFAEGT